MSTTLASIWPTISVADREARRRRRPVTKINGVDDLAEHAGDRARAATAACRSPRLQRAEDRDVEHLRNAIGDDPAEPASAHL